MSINTAPLIAIMLLAILSLSDDLFTLHLIERGATEENPVSHGDILALQLMGTYSLC